MKSALLIFTLIAAQVAFAKARKIEFNELIEKQSASQTETHSALAKDINPSAIGSSSADRNRIILLRTPVLMQSSDSIGKTNKIRISSTEQLEENDFSRLDQELGIDN